MQGSYKTLRRFCTDFTRFCSALHTLLMMTAESMLSKRPVLRFVVALHFLVKDELHVINNKVCCELSYLFLSLLLAHNTSCPSIYAHVYI